MKKCECCKNIEEARKHISRYIESSLQRGFDEEMLLEDNGVLYVVEGAKGYVSHDYQNYELTDLGNGTVTMEIAALDSGGGYDGTDVFTLEKAEECYKIVAVKEG